MATRKPKEKNTRGRKTLKTPATQKLLIEAIQSGATNRLACLYAGISESSFYEWLNESVDFSEAIKRAQGVGAIEHLQNIKEHAKNNWQTSAWWLERVYPNEYGRRTVDVNHSGAIALTWEAVMKDALTDGDADEDDFS